MANGSLAQTIGLAGLGAQAALAKSTTKVTTAQATPAASAPQPLLYQPYPLTNEWRMQEAAPISQPVANGYDIAAARLSSSRRAVALNSANSILTSPVGGDNYQMSLFITDVQMDSQLVGTTAQAQLTRDFYPHNFVQPTIQCTGVSIDQEDFGMLCEFIHAAQHYAIENGQTGLTQLFIAGRNNPSPYGNAFNRGISGNRPRNSANRNVSVSGASSGAMNGTWWNQNIKGTHQPILAQGYVNSMPREHQQFEYVVQWELDFIVTVMLDGIYTDQSLNAASLLQDSNTSLMDSVTSNAMPITAALQKQNKAALAYAASNASTFFPASQTNFGGNSGSSGSSPGGSTPASGTFTGGPLSSGSDLTIKGSPMNSTQLQYANEVLTIGKQLGASSTGVAIVMTQAIAESSMGEAMGWDATNPTYGGLLAGNISYFGSLGSSTSAAVTNAEITSALQGNKGFNYPGGVLKATSGTDIGQAAMTNSGSGDQYEQEASEEGTTLSAWVQEAQAIVSAAAAEGH